MTTIDFVLAAVIGVSALFGLMRGFIGALASLLAWLLAGWAAFHYGGVVAQLLAGARPPDATELFGGYALCFIGVMIVVGLIGWLVRTLVKAIGLSGLDRLAGLALGLLRGALIACVMLVLMAFTALPRQPAWQQSMLVPLLRPAAQWLTTWLPEWTVSELDFGNRAPAGDNARLPNSSPSPETSGASRARDPAQAAPVPN